MTDLAVHTTGLRKTYTTVKGRRVAVQGLDLSVPVGGVHGFLGPNGSGKTTSIRMLLGLIRPDAGSMELFGRPVPRELPQVISRVGAIVESPKFFPTFSGRKNLSLLAQSIGTPRHRVEEVLEETGLRDRGQDRFSSYSLGMKQRLAIAATLLKQPDLLIFDEPTNGLDPAGIREVRGTMRRLGDEGRTVLVSSHILAEVQQIADTVSIIAQGRLLAEGRVADIVHAGDAPVRAVVPDVAAAVRALEEQGVRAQSDGMHVVVDGGVDPAEVNRLLGARGIWASELTRPARDLESAFLDLTRDDTLGAGGAR